MLIQQLLLNVERTFYGKLIPKFVTMLLMKLTLMLTVFCLEIFFLKTSIIILILFQILIKSELQFVKFSILIVFPTGPGKAEVAFLAAQTIRQDLNSSNNSFNSPFIDPFKILPPHSSFHPDPDHGSKGVSVPEQDLVPLQLPTNHEDLLKSGFIPLHSSLQSIPSNPQKFFSKFKESWFSASSQSFGFKRSFLMSFWIAIFLLVLVFMLELVSVICNLWIFSFKQERGSWGSYWTVYGSYDTSYWSIFSVFTKVPISLATYVLHVLSVLF
ncbi:uncharacterized protein LOC128665038 [Bombina bombina]|uniref:uncharacterized protein LOC128665038 n=1 Tax=Bombina bombina TaxID=8345 RepID=UPI00235AFA4C|nr:uncharacterized protein LOC128665038 [Bombina bombina]